MDDRPALIVVADMEHILLRMCHVIGTASAAPAIVALGQLEQAFDRLTIEAEMAAQAGREFVIAARPVPPIRDTAPPRPPVPGSKAARRATPLNIWKKP